MMNSVLLLNQHFLPLNVISIQKAILMSFKDKIEVVEYETDNYFSSNNERINVPIVVRMKYFVNVSKKKKAGDFSKLNLWKRDKGVCQYCGVKTPIDKYTVDHVYPKSKGGKSEWLNVVISCFPCNNKKGNKSLAEAKLKLLNEPTIPNYDETIEQTIYYKIKSLYQNRHEKWNLYLK